MTATVKTAYFNYIANRLSNITLALSYNDLHKQQQEEIRTITIERV